MSNYAIIRIEKKKNLGALAKAYAHNYRTAEWAAPRSIGEYKNRNQELIETDFGVRDRNFVEIYRKKIAESEYYKHHNVRKNAVPAIEILMSYSKEMDNEIDIERWKEKNVKWLKKTYGEDNVISCMLHDDESYDSDLNGTGKHLHAIVIPFDKKGALNASEVVGGRTQLSVLLSDYAKEMGEFGLVRGDFDSGDKHLKPSEFHKMVDSDMERTKKMIPEPQKEESAQAYAERIEESLWMIVRDHREQLLEAERRTRRYKDQLSGMKKKQSLDDELRDIQANKNARRKEKSFDEIRDLLGWGDKEPTKEEIHDAKKRLRYANNVVAALQTYPDRERALQLNNDIAEILRYYNHSQKEKAEKKREEN